MALHIIAYHRISSLPNILLSSHNRQICGLLFTLCQTLLFAVWWAWITKEQGTKRTQILGYVVQKTSKYLLNACTCSFWEKLVSVLFARLIGTFFHCWFSSLDLVFSLWSDWVQNRRKQTERLLRGWHGDSLQSGNTISTVHLYINYSSCYC